MNLNRNTWKSFKNNRIFTEIKFYFIIKVGKILYLKKISFSFVSKKIIFKENKLNF